MRKEKLLKSLELEQLAQKSRLIKEKLLKSSLCKLSAAAAADAAAMLATPSAESGPSAAEAADAAATAATPSAESGPSAAAAADAAATIATPSAESGPGPLPEPWKICRDCKLPTRCNISFWTHPQVGVDMDKEPCFFCHRRDWWHIPGEEPSDMD